jgi:hypothetical protein
LTADQFTDESQPTVIVAVESPWHATWKILPSEERTIDREYSKRARVEWYETPYQKILSCLQSANASEKKFVRGHPEWGADDLKFLSILI